MKYPKKLNESNENARLAMEKINKIYPERRRLIKSLDIKNGLSLPFYIMVLVIKRMNMIQNLRGYTMDYNKCFFGILVCFLSFQSYAINLEDYFNSSYSFDKVYFLCETDKGKFIALYGDVNNEKKPVSLFYSYGYKNKTEITYPSLDLKNSLKAFEYKYYSRPLTSYLFITFNNKGYSYTLKDTQENGVESISLGVRTLKNDKEYNFCVKVF
ncbi:hypothetical protein [Limnobaculum parvum]|nr:hypothetical protein [Limnobaculum parvum]